MKDRIFYSICFGFGFGVLARSFLGINFYTTLFIFCLSVFVFALSYFTPNQSKLGTGQAQLKWGVIGAIFFSAFSLGILLFHSVDKPAPDVFESQVGQEVELVGTIVDEPDIRENNQKLTIEARIGDEETKILTTINFDDSFKYGDQVIFSGVLEKPENFITDQGKEFDYVNYLRKDGIFYIMGYPDVEILSSGHGSRVKSALFSIKGKFLEKINLAIPHPESLLMGGLILGERASFGADMRQKFIDTGTIHIVALSGYNVTIVAEWIMRAFAFLPRNLGFGAGILGIFLFVIMAGGSSTALRAGIMATLVLIARATGRTYDVGRALVVAGVAMILLNPFVLVYDVSFQLSFIATVAVIFFTPKVEKYFMWVPKRFGLRDVVSITFSAYVFVLPFILYKMGNLSLVALPANVLILPFIPLTMGLGFLTGFLGLIFYVLAVPFGYLSFALLHYELRVVDALASFSFASFTVPNFPLWLTVLVYAYFIYKLFGTSIKKLFWGPQN